jgi:chromosome segregation ATPase
LEQARGDYDGLVDVYNYAVDEITRRTTSIQAENDGSLREKNDRIKSLTHEAKQQVKRLKSITGKYETLSDSHNTLVQQHAQASATVTYLGQVASTLNLRVFRLSSRLALMLAKNSTIEYTLNRQSNAHRTSDDQKVQAIEAAWALEAQLRTEDTTIAALEVCVESLQRQMIEFWENREAQAGPARRTGPRHG